MKAWTFQQGKSLSNHKGKDKTNQKKQNLQQWDVVKGDGNFQTLSLPQRDKDSASMELKQDVYLKETSEEKRVLESRQGRVETKLSAGRMEDSWDTPKRQRDGKQERIENMEDLSNTDIDECDKEKVGKGMRQESLQDWRTQVSDQAGP